MKKYLLDCSVANIPILLTMRKPPCKRLTSGLVALVVVRVCMVRPVQTKTDQIYICIFSPYRAVNTHRLGYTNQSVNVV